jgi:hypothetical protein
MAHVGAQILAKNQQIHLGKLSSYFGRWPERIKMLLDDVDAAVQQGRRVLVLSNSEGEIINLAALWESGNWTNNTATHLFTDIPMPSPVDVGETLMPIELGHGEDRRHLRYLERCQQKLQAGNLTAAAQAKLLSDMAGVEQILRQYDIYKKILAEYERRQKRYVKALLTRMNRGGLMIHKVPPLTRLKFVEDKQVVFAIVKYGKESLDSPALDTIIISTPFSSKNGLQQVMGRSSRVHSGKKKPLVIFYEDDLGLLIGMCQKLKKHLREWPVEEGGPFAYETVNHPKLTRKTCSLPILLGQ